MGSDYPSLVEKINFQSYLGEIRTIRFRTLPDLEILPWVSPLYILDKKSFEEEDIISFLRNIRKTPLKKASRIILLGKNNFLRQARAYILGEPMWFF